MTKFEKYPNTIAMVTGASSGIGEALCKELVARGWTVVGVARSDDKLKGLQASLGSQFLPVVCDVSDIDAIKRVSQELLQKGVCPSLFFLNAGITGWIAAEERHHFQLEIHQRVMNVNYFGVLAWIEAWEEPCKKNGGANFLVTSSVSAFFAAPTSGAYSASKSAINRAFESLRYNNFDTNLLFSIAYPGPVETPGSRKILPFPWSPEKLAIRMVDQAMKRKLSYEPSFFYSMMTRLLQSLPTSWTMKAINLLSKKE